MNILQHIVRQMKVRPIFEKYTVFFLNLQIDVAAINSICCQTDMGFFLSYSACSAALNRSLFLPTKDIDFFSSPATFPTCHVP